MAFISKTGLRPHITLTNGAESIAFIETPIVYKQTDVSFASAYFNPITGLFDSNMSTLIFSSGESILIDQLFSTTSTELLPA